MCNWPGLSYLSSFVFFLEKQILVANISLALYFLWKNRYMQPVRPLISFRLGILSRKISTSCKYMSGFIFFVREQILLISQTFNIFWTMYFLWKNRYWLQVHIQPYILGEKTGICNWSSVRYLSSFVFLVKKQVTIADIYLVSSFC